MQLKRAIAAGALGALMAGSTLAFAASLSDFPAPFVQAGAANFLMVVGETAATSDVVGAIDLAARLGGEPVTEETETVSTGTVAAAGMTNGARVEEPGQDLNYGNSIADIEGFDSRDLTTVLADGTYEESEGNNDNDVAYDQEIDFNAATATIVFEADDNAATEPAGTYLFLDADVIAYTYTLDFTEPVVFDDGVDADCAADLEDTSITLQGKTYTVSDVTCDVDLGDNIVSIELLGGAVESVLDHSEAGTFTIDDVAYTLTPKIYTDEVVFTVTYGGTTEILESLADGETDTLGDGTEIGVRDILTSAKEGTPDSVRFYVGAQKLTLIDDGAVEINDDEIDDYETAVDINSPDGDGELNFITIAVTPEDDLWVGTGDSWTDPVFGAWKVTFTGLEQNTEEITATANDDIAKLEFTNNAGDDIELPVVYSADGLVTAWGEDDLFIDGDVGAGNAEGSETTGLGGNSIGMAYADDQVCEFLNGNEVDCEGFLFLATAAGGEARLFSIDDIDETGADAGTYDVIDEQTGETIQDDVNFGDDVDVGLPDDINIDLDSDDDEVQFDVINWGDIETSLAGVLTLATTATAATADLTDSEDNVQEGAVSYDDTDDDDEIEITTSAATIPEVKDSDIEVGIDDEGYGTMFTIDTDNNDDLTIEYPEELVIASVWMSSVAATQTAAAAGTVTYTTQTVAPIKTMVGKVDTEFLDLSPADQQAKNVISIGGPCVNKVTAKLMFGNTTAMCGPDSGIAENTALIKLVENALGGNKAALVVAGYNADNTRDATSALQNFETAALTGLVKVLV